MERKEISTNPVSTGHPYNVRTNREGYRKWTFRQQVWIMSLTYKFKRFLFLTAHIIVTDGCKYLVGNGGIFGGIKCQIGHIYGETVDIIFENNKCNSQQCVTLAIEVPNVPKLLGLKFLPWVFKTFFKGNIFEEIFQMAFSKFSLGEYVSFETKSIAKERLLFKIQFEVEQLIKDIGTFIKNMIKNKIIILIRNFFKYIYCIAFRNGINCILSDV